MRLSNCSGSKVITDPGELGPDLLELLFERNCWRVVRHGASDGSYRQAEALGAVAALELLAAAAPARVVAADLLAVARHALLRHHRAAAGIERASGHAPAVAEHQPGRGGAACRRHRLRARQRLVLVRESIPGLRGLRPLERICVLDLDLRVEERRD